MTVVTALVLIWIDLCAAVYNVDPDFAKAVARIESGTKTQEYRIGRLGKSPYYGPFGIHKDFLKKWPIDDPMVNVVVGVRALRGKDKRRVLHRYNPKANSAYLRAVFAYERQLKRERRER